MTTCSLGPSHLSVCLCIFIFFCFLPHPFDYIYIYISLIINQLASKKERKAHIPHVGSHIQGFFRGVVGMRSRRTRRVFVRERYS
jgi:hypothetical protein